MQKSLKKALSLVIALMMLMSMITLPSVSAATDPIMGDVNGDGYVTITDATAIQMALAKLTAVTPEQEYLADVDGSEGVTIKDATYIQMYIAKLLDNLATNSDGLSIGDTVVPVEPTDPTQDTNPTQDTDPTQDTSEAPADTMTIYFTNNWMWDVPTIYYWGSKTGENPNWPGNAMTFVRNSSENYGIYNAEVPTDVTGIIFVGVNADGTVKEQSVNIESGFEDGLGYYMVWDDATGTKTVGTYTYSGPELTTPSESESTSTSEDTDPTTSEDTDPTTSEDTDPTTSEDTDPTQDTSEDTDPAPVLSNVALPGSFNNWNSSAYMYVVDDTTVTTTLTLEAGTYEFKVKNGSTWLGNDGTIEDTTTTTSETGWTMKDAGNCTLKATGGTYTFNFNTTTNRLIILYQAPETEDTTPSESTSDDTTPSESTSDDTTPSESTSDDTTPSESTSDDTTPSESTSDDTTPAGLSKEYTIIGYIDGADVGCEGDYQNDPYIFNADGTVTVTFAKDSYVFVKTTDDQNWFMASAYCTDTTVTLANTSTGANEKMFVPAGTVTFTLVENADGTLTLSYTVETEDTTASEDTTSSEDTTPSGDDVVYTIYYVPVASNIDAGCIFKANIKDADGTYHNYSFVATDETYNGDAVYSLTITNPSYSDLEKVQYQVCDSNGEWMNQIVVDTVPTLAELDGTVLVASTSKLETYVADVVDPTTSEDTDPTTSEDTDPTTSEDTDPTTSEDTDPTQDTSEDTDPAPVLSNVALPGSFNNWNSSAYMYVVDDTTVTTTLTLEAGTYEFKVKVGSTWLGNDGTIEDTTTTTSETGWTMKDAGNCTLKATGGTYTFNFNTTTNRLIILYQAPETEDTTPSESTSDDTTPSESTSDDTTPSESTSDDTTPSESTSDDTTPSESTSDDTTPAGLSKEYTIIGYIDGADVGCEGDYQNDPYIFNADGTVTVTFAKDSYVFVKTTDDQNWYMTSAYCTDTTATLLNTSTGAQEKMFVPAGTVTFTLVENADGTLTLSYTVETEDTTASEDTTSSEDTTPSGDDVVYTIYYVPVASNIDAGCIFKANIKDADGTYHNYSFVETDETYNGDAVYSLTLTNPSYSDLEKVQYQVCDSNGEWMSQIVVDTVPTLAELDGTVLVASTSALETYVADVVDPTTSEDTDPTTSEDTDPTTSEDTDPTTSEDTDPTQDTSEDTDPAPVLSNVALLGSFNNWNSSAYMYVVDDTTVTTTLTLEAGTYEFKVKVGSTWLGNDGTIEDTTTTTSETGWTMKDAGNCTLKATGGTYTFNFNTTTNRLIILYQAPETEDTTPSESTSNDTTPSESTSDDTTPSESTSDDTTPSESTSDDTTPSESTSDDTTPAGLSKEYTIIGYIDGADVGCEGDYQNDPYIFNADGTVTVTFAKDSYVFVKTTDDQNWYMTSAYCTDTTATLLNTSTGANEKMFVPAGTVTFTLVENADGTLTLSYTVETEDTTASEDTTSSEDTTAPEDTDPTTSEDTDPTTSEDTDPTQDTSEDTDPTQDTSEDTDPAPVLSNVALLGSFNNWDTTAYMYVVDDTTVTTTLTLEAGTYEFKVKVGSTWLGNDGTIEDTTTTTSETGWTMKDAGNCTLKATGGTYTFNFNTTTNRLIILYQAPETEDTTPSESTSNDTTPSESTSDDTTPSESTSDDTTPSESTSDDTDPSESVTPDETDPSEPDETDPTQEPSEGNDDVVYTLYYVPLASNIEAGCTYKANIKDADGTYHNYSFVATDETYNGDAVYSLTLTNPSYSGIQKIQYQLCDAEGTWISQIVVETVPTLAELDGTVLVASTSALETYVADTATPTVPDDTDPSESVTPDETDPSVPDETDPTDPDETDPTDPAPVLSNVALAGSFNGWSSTPNMYVADGNFVTLTLELEAGTYEFKVINNGTWYGNNGTIADTTASSATGWSMKTSAGNCKLTATGGTYTFNYDTVNNRIYVLYTA